MVGSASSVSFHVQGNLNSFFNKQNSTITFGVTLTNKGNAMNGTNGNFTAPIQGNYFFTFNGLPEKTCHVTYLVNGKSVSASWTGANRLTHISMSALLPLKKDDTVQVKMIQGHLWNGLITGYVADGAESYLNFMGFLLP